jgi:hypothetical protein
MYWSRSHTGPAGTNACPTGERSWSRATEGMSYETANPHLVSNPNTVQVFTLVDTASMTVTLFTAVRPPVGFILVGSEGGMQRAVGVSLDWPNGTLVKETVIRVETQLIERMDRIPRARVALSKKLESDVRARII